MTDHSLNALAVDECGGISNCAHSTLLVKEHHFCPGPIDHTVSSSSSGVVADQTSNEDDEGKSMVVSTSSEKRINHSRLDIDYDSIVLTSSVVAEQYNNEDDEVRHP